MAIVSTTTGATGGALFHPLLALSSGGGPLDFDKTVIYQALLFLVLMVVLKPLLFDPVLKIFALREEKTEGRRASARDLQERAGELLQKYEGELVKVHQVAAEERQRLRAETAKLEGEILKEAREATTRIVEDGRKRIEVEVARVRAELVRESERASKDIVVGVLGREGN